MRPKRERIGKRQVFCDLDEPVKTVVIGLKAEPLYNREGIQLQGEDY